MSRIGDAKNAQTPPIVSRRPSIAPKICVVAARAANGVIGAAGKLPWHLPEDLKHFKALTLARPVIMGRRTWESIGKPLPGRTNVVVTRRRDYAATGALVAHTLAEAIRKCADADTVFVIGGGELYIEALDIADAIVLTEIKAAFDGDTRFPELRPSDWTIHSRTHHRAASGLEFEITRYERVARV